MTSAGGTIEYEALGFDPAPGEVERITASAEQYGRVSKQLTAAMEAIESIIDQRGVWEGEASEAFARRVGDLPKYLGKATESMSEASKAVGDWSTSLAEMQRKAQDLEFQARRARDDAEAARQNPAFELAGQTFTDQAALDAAQRALDEATRRLDVAIDKLERIIEDAERLREHHDEAAERIADLIDRAREIAPDKPGMLSGALDALGDALSDAFNDVIDFATDVIQEIGDFIADNANLIAQISTILGDISTVIGVVADFLPPPADTIVGAVSLGLGVYALGGHLLAKAAGADVSWETIMLDSVGVGTGLVGLIPLVPGGVANAAFQAGYEGAARFNGEDGGTTVGKFIPRDGRQWAMAAGGILVPGLGGAYVAENFARDWVGGVGDAVEKDNAGQAERDRRRAEERVWDD